MSKDKPQRSKQRKPFVRSVFNLGEFCDHEVNNQDSMTDPSQDEPIQKLVERMMRGEHVSMGHPVYDSIAPGTDPEVVFAGQSATERKGFDLADAPGIMEAAKNALQGIKKPEGVKTPEAPQKPQEGAIPVEKKEGQEPEEAKN